MRYIFLEANLPDPFLPALDDSITLQPLSDPAASVGWKDSLLYRAKGKEAEHECSNDVKICATLGLR